ncbi:glyoxal oxidase [Rhizoctonia solani]|nr:glyoxal oxidase [Rhizoctonia solani]
MSSSRRSPARVVTLATFLATGAAAAPEVLPKPGQPTKSGKPGTFEIIGDSGVSAMQLFLGTENRVYIVDKTENNPPRVGSPEHAAWATEYDLETNTFRPMDVVTNSFCAGGGVLGNGTWLNVGGNQAVTWGGLTASSQDGNDDGPYHGADGGTAIRLLNPCDDKKCNWWETHMTSRRWYPTLENLEDGSLMIIGGNKWGGFVNSADQNNPTYEFFPSRGDHIGLNILTTTLPANLYPLTWLLPTGNLLIQSNWKTIVYNYKNLTEYPLPDIPHAVRTYPASGGMVMLPLTPKNNFTATVMFCGGSDLQPNQWVENWDISKYPADSSCVKISPDVSTEWETDDELPEGRTLGSMILLPTGEIFMVNGANTGVAGYGNVSWAIGQSYADQPVYTPIIYNPEAPAGSRWSRDGLGDSTVARMYHSGATILPDGSVFVSGSNPNADYNVGKNVQYPTEYRVERFYPLYYSKRRPEPVGLLSQLAYGGNYFNVSLSSEDLGGNASNIAKAKVVVIRPGFSTHALNMGQRYIQLDSSYTGNEDNSGVLHVSQLPPNPAIFPPGPALVFVVVDGVPSIGQTIMVGSGKIETQPTQTAAALPQSRIATVQDPSNGNNPSGSGNNNNGATRSCFSFALTGIVGLVLVGLFA